MTRIIHRYIFRDLLKVFALTSLAMTLIFSLSSILRPIQEYGISPGQVFKLLWYFSPVMFSFVMPIAAVFAASITYGRFASDNEYDACRASGISVHSLAMPGLLLAVIVAISSLLLSFYIVPSYIDKAERSVQANAREIIFRSLERNGYYKDRQDKFEIIADVVLPKQNRLLGVNILEFRNQKASWLVTASLADVDIETHRNYNNIVAIAKDAYYIDGKTQGYSKVFPVMGRFGSLLRDKIKFLKFRELEKVRKNPYLFGPIQNELHRVSDQLSAEMFAERISQAVSDGGAFEMATPARRLIVSCQGARAGKDSTVYLLGNVEVTEYDTLFADRLIKTWKSQDASIYLDNDRSWVMSLPKAVWTTPDGVEGLSSDYYIRGIQMPDDMKDMFSQENAIDTIANAAPQNATDTLVRLKADIEKDVVGVIGDIWSEINFRLVFSLGCIALVITGMSLGILFKGGHLLTAFGLSAMPAGFLIIFLVTGDNVTKNTVRSTGEFSYTGIYIMWTGFVLLSLIAAIVYKRLNRT